MHTHTFFDSETEQSPQTVTPEVMLLLVILSCLGAAILMTTCLVHYFCLQRDLDVDRSIRHREPIHVDGDGMNSVLSA